jgi:hypothetical protein
LESISGLLKSLKMPSLTELTEGLLKELSILGYNKSESKSLNNGVIYANRTLYKLSSYWLGQFSDYASK